MELFDLSGCPALVTSSAMGIGSVLARGLVQTSVTLVLNARNADRLEETANVLRAERASVSAEPFDLIEAEAMRTAFDGFVAHQGKIDILVNNAGTRHRTPLEDFPADQIERLMLTNVNSVSYFGQAVARHMIGRGTDEIINLASMQTALACPGFAPYTTTKCTMANLTKAIATDWSRHGLNYRAIAPGFFDTSRNAALDAGPEFSVWLEKRTRRAARARPRNWRAAPSSWPPMLQFSSTVTRFSSMAASRPIFGKR